MTAEKRPEDTGGLTIDYRALLARYMRHVRQCEGSTFVDAIADGWGSAEVSFSDAEVAELDRLDAAIGADPWAKDVLF